MFFLSWKTIHDRNQFCITFVILIQMGLTGFDSKCNHRARMQAGVCTALKNSYAL